MVYGVKGKSEVKVMIEVLVHVSPFRNFLYIANRPATVLDNRWKTVVVKASL